METAAQMFATMVLAVSRITPTQSPGVGRVVLSNWAFARVGNILVLCTQGEEAPPEPDFDIFMQRLAVRDYKASMVHGQGGLITATQRARIAAYFKTSGGVIPPCALLTDAMTVRAVMTALSWLMTGWELKTFSLMQIEAAVRWLNDPISPAIIAAEVAGMHTALRSNVFPGRPPFPNDGGPSTRR
jgi:hypothetical protein